MTGRIVRALVAGCLLFSCSGNKKPAENLLKGTLWTSDFYHYHNNYFFQTDSTGFSQDGQYAWSCPIDTAALHISGDSVLLGGNEEFKYTLKDSVLTIKYLSEDTALGTRVFYFYRGDTRAHFVSEHTFSYGKEVLTFKKSLEDRRE